jgi:hypothetical protein
VFSSMSNFQCWKDSFSQHALPRRKAPHYQCPVHHLLGHYIFRLIDRTQKTKILASILRHKPHIYLAPAVGPQNTVACLHAAVGMINSLMFQNVHESVIQWVLQHDFLEKCIYISKRKRDIHYAFGYTAISITWL